MKDFASVSELEDKDLHELMEEGSYLEKLLDGRGGDIIRRACKRVVDRHEKSFIFEKTQSDLQTTEYKVAIKFYKYNLFEAFNLLIKDGESADKELKLRKEENYGEPTSEQGNEQDS